ncbi:MAG: hypothetical protein ABGX07_07460 [Pirellulaceae bacterium]
MRIGTRQPGFENDMLAMVYEEILPEGQSLLARMHETRVHCLNQHSNANARLGRDFSRLFYEPCLLGHLVFETRWVARLLGMYRAASWAGMAAQEIGNSSCFS